MKRRNLRTLGCACLGIGLLIAAHPATAQTTAAPPAAKPAAAKPAAKPAAKKVARWVPRSRWRRPVRWSRYSRWAHPVAKKPATAWHPAAYAAKPGVKTAAKPAAKPAWHPAYAVKPAAKPVWHPAAKTTAWTKPAAKPAAAWRAATAKQAAKITTAKTAAKPNAKPAAKPAVKTVAKTQPAPLSMTRDANNGASAATASPIAGAGQLDYLGQAGRTLASTAIVLLLVFGGLYAYKRFKGMQANFLNATPQGSAQSANAKGLGVGVMPVFSNLAGSRPGNGAPATNDLALGQSEIGDGGLKIVGLQPLPGSGTIIYLVQIEDHMVLLGASQAGGVRTLAEWEQDNQPAAEKEKAAFESFLRQQGIAAVSPREDEEHTFASIRARLNSTADRLAGLRADFGS